MKTLSAFRLLPFALCFCATGATIHSAQAAPKASKSSQAVPAKLLGKWSKTLISGTTYWDSTTGAYAGSGAGGSQTYTFLPGGRYKFFNYVKTNSYGWETQALTWEDGNFVVNGSTITLRPTTGRYQVMDNRVSKNNYKRPMRANERKVSQMIWKLDTRDGKPILKMGKNASSPTEFKKEG